MKRFTTFLALCLAGFAGASISPSMFAMTTVQATNTLTAVIVAATGVAATDTAAVQTGFNTAVSTKRPLVLNATSTPFAINAGIVVKPSGTDTFCSGLRVYAYNKGGAYPTLTYSGTGTGITLRGLKGSTFDGVVLRCTGTGATAWSVETYGDYQSTSRVVFQHCNTQLFGLTERGWGVGANGSGGADVSSIRWEDCYVTGDSGNITALGGWFLHGGNTLNLIWTNCSADNLNGYGWNFYGDSAYSPTDAGGDGSVLMNCGVTGYGAVRISTGFKVAVFGGRSENCANPVFYAGAGSAPGNLDVYNYTFGNCDTHSQAVGTTTVTLH